MTRALVVDDYELFRVSLRRLLASRAGYDAIEELATAADFIQAAAQGAPVALAIIHPASMGLSERDCLQLAERLIPNGAILLFSDGKDGAPGLRERPRVKRLSRTAGCDEVEAALVDLERVSRPLFDGAGVPLSAGASGAGAAPGVAPAGVARLSRRQREILEMLTEGLANKEIGHRLGIAEGTVKGHIHAIFRALGVSNRTQAVMRYSGGSQGPQESVPSGLDEARLS